MSEKDFLMSLDPPPSREDYDYGLSPRMWEVLVEIFQAGHKSYPHEQIHTGEGRRQIGTRNALGERGLIFPVSGRNRVEGHNTFYVSEVGASLAFAYLQGQKSKE